MARVKGLKGPTGRTPIFVRRTQLAKARGFKSLGEQRKALTKAKTSAVWHRATLPTPTVRTAESAKLISLWYDAFYKNPDDYSVDGPKAKWFVEVAGIMDYDEWQQRYPNGIREYMPVAA